VECLDLFSQTRNIQFLLPQNLIRVNHRELHVIRESGSCHAKRSGTPCKGRRVPGRKSEDLQC
jgi:hypothetical protein